MLYKEFHAPQRELYSCQKPVEWEVTITVHYTVITDLSLLSLTILYPSVGGVHFQTALMITQHRRTLIGQFMNVGCMAFNSYLGSTAYFVNVSCALFWSGWRFAFMSSYTALHLNQTFFFFPVRTRTPISNLAVRAKCVPKNHQGR